MKKTGIIVAIILAIIIGCGFYYNNVTKTPLKGDEVTIVVETGDTFYGVLNTLKKEGALKNRMLLGIYVKFNDISPALVPGNFTVDGDITLNEMVKVLEDGKVDSNTMVTIPEGYDIEGMAQLFEEKGLFTADEFINAVKAYSVPKSIPVSQSRKYNLEGFLFPDTYAFKEGITPNEVIETMINQFNNKIDEVMVGREDNIYDIITMASIVEKEAAISEERPVIASVFYNRLKDGIKFQSCATVLYALGDHRDKLYENDLTIESPYNTYIVDGYPEGPICSPGLEAIKAALNPSDTNYIYFVSNNDGSHFFTDNYDEFLRVKEETQGF